MEFPLEVKGEVKEQEQDTLSMEDALAKIGGFSKFQVMMVIVLTLIDFPNALMHVNPILTDTAQVKWTCQGVVDGGQVEIPDDDLCSFNCSGQIVPSGKEPYNSIVQEWRLICHKSWIPDAILSFHLFGRMVGAIIVAYCCDRFGRKKAFYSITFCMGFSGILSAAAPNPIFFAVTRFISGFISGGIFASHFNYLMEFLPPKYRQICGCVSFWSFGEMSLALFGYLIPSWRTICWVTPLPAFIIFITVLFVPESPRWALANGKIRTAEKALEKMARWNSKPKLSAAEFKRLEATIRQEVSLENKMKEQTLRSLTDLKLLRIVLAFSLAWFSNAAVYWGISYNMKNLSGDPYWNIFWLGLVDLPAELSGFYFSNRFGRRNSFITLLLISSVFLAGVVVVEIYFAEITWLTLVLGLAGKFFLESSWCVMACFTSESFPTVCRSFSLSICYSSASIGAMVAPQLIAPHIPKSVPYIIFTGLAIVSSVVGLTIPEMNGKNLVDS